MSMEVGRRSVGIQTLDRMQLTCWRANAGSRGSWEGWRKGWQHPTRLSKALGCSQQVICGCRGRGLNIEVISFRKMDVDCSSLLYDLPKSYWDLAEHLGKKCRIITTVETKKNAFKGDSMISGWQKLQGQRLSSWQLLPRAEGARGLGAEAALTQLIKWDFFFFLQQLIEQLELWISYNFLILQELWLYALVGARDLMQKLSSALSRERWEPSLTARSVTQTFTVQLLSKNQQ